MQVKPKGIFLEKLLWNEVNPPAEIADPSYLSAQTIYSGESFEVDTTEDFQETWKNQETFKKGASLQFSELALKK